MLIIVTLNTEWYDMKRLGLEIENSSNFFFAEDESVCSVDLTWL